MPNLQQGFLKCEENVVPNDCNKYKYVFAPDTLGILLDTYLVPVSHVMGQELGMSMPYEYTWGLSMEQRGTTDLTIYTAFIHLKTSIKADITSQHMIGQPYELHLSPDILCAENEQL